MKITNSFFILILTILLFTLISGCTTLPSWCGGICWSPNICCNDRCYSPCPNEFIIGSDDCLCHPKCGQTYCKEGFECCNSNCVSECPAGYTRETDCQCKRPETQLERNVRILQEIMENYHSTHTYLAPDIFVCGDMASDVWNMVKTQGINAKIQVGNVDKVITSVQDANHAWVLAEISPDNWIALECTGGYLVCNDRSICNITNPLYFQGWSFDDTKEFKDLLDKLKHPCSEGYILGNDYLCHQACGGAYYCTENTVCVNGRCVGCNPGYVMGDDLQCHQECPIGSGRYCIGEGICINGQCRSCNPGYILGNDMLCHVECGSGTYCTGDSICINGRCMGCNEGYILGDDYQCYKECPPPYSNQYCKTGTCGTDGKCHLW